MSNITLKTINVGKMDKGFIGKKSILKYTKKLIFLEIIYKSLIFLPLALSYP